MGTFFTVGATKAGIIREILESLKDSLVTSTFTHGDGEPVLWTVEKRSQKGRQYKHKVICCYVLRQDDQGNWGYKPMDETVHPCFYSVPIEWIDKYPCNIRNVMSRRWRLRVKEHHAGIEIA